MQGCQCPGCQSVTLPASFTERSAPELGNATTVPSSTPLERPDPTAAWYDLSTVANVVSIVSNILRS